MTADIGKSIEDEISEAGIRERIAKNAATVTEWAAACLVMDANASAVISELYAHYEDYCRRENCQPLPRKTWIGAMKMANFQTVSGAFARLRIQ